MRFLVRLCFGDGFLIGGGLVVDVSVPPQEVLQCSEILSDDVSVVINGEVTDLVAVGRQSQIAGSRAQFLCNGLGQCLAVGRVGRNGHEKNLLCVFCMPLLTLNAHKVNGLWAHNANNHSSHGMY